jgi:hypothetical protein
VPNQASTSPGPIATPPERAEALSEGNDWPLAGFAGLSVEGSDHRARSFAARRLGQLPIHLPGSFRMPNSTDPAPEPQRLIGMCSWAAALGLLGLMVAARALWALMTGLAPDWFEPAVIGVGLLGIGLTAAGFTAIHRRYLPWGLLTAASATLVATTTMVISAL